MVNKSLLFDVPLRSKVTKLFGYPQNDVMSVCSKFGYAMLKCCWEQAYFLFGCFAVKFDWLSRPNGFEYEKAVGHIFQLGLKIIYAKFHEDWT